MLFNMLIGIVISSTFTKRENLKFRDSKTKQQNYMKELPTLNNILLNSVEIYNQNITKSINASIANYSIFDCIFINCNSDDTGGALTIKNENHTYLTIFSTNFYHCTSKNNGGALFCITTQFALSRSCFSKCSSVDGIGFIIFTSQTNYFVLNQTVFINTLSSTTDAVHEISQKSDACQLNFTSVQTGKSGSAALSISSPLINLASSSFLNLTGLYILSFMQSEKTNVNLCNFDTLNASTSIIFLQNAKNFVVSYCCFVQSHCLTILFRDYPPLFVQCTFDAVSSMIDASAVIENCITGAQIVKTIELQINEIVKCLGAPQNVSSYIAIRTSHFIVIVLTVLFIFILCLIYAIRKKRVNEEPVNKAETWQPVDPDGNMDDYEENEFL